MPAVGSRRKNWIEKERIRNVERKTRRLRAKVSANDVRVGLQKIYSGLRLRCTYVAVTFIEVINLSVVNTRM